MRHGMLSPSSSLKEGPWRTVPCMQRCSENSTTCTVMGWLETVQDASWFWCTVGLAVAMPLGVRLKSYSPIIYFGLGGTATDLIQGLHI